MSSSIQKEPEIDWRSTCNSQLTRKLYTLDHGLFSDVSFSVGSKGEVIRCHRLTLSIGSPIFQAMLTGKSFDQNPIQIPDIQPNGFKPLLKYLYTYEIPEIPDEDYMEFFRAVKFFKVEELIEVGRKNILKKLGLGNALNIYESGKLLEEKELEETADGLIKKNAESILAQPKFSELSAENLLHFISSDDFSAPEVPICLAVYKWGEAECERHHLKKSPENIRIVLKTVIPQIRFPLMNSGDFAVKIAKLNLLTLEETVAIHNYFFARHHERNQIPEGGRFISKPRKYVNHENDDKVDNVVWTLTDGINTGLRTDRGTIYTISNKGVGSTNYLNVNSNSFVVVTTKDLAKYEFGGAGYCSTLWGIRRGSKPNNYSLFSKYKNGYLIWLTNDYFRVFGPEDKREFLESENLTFEPSKKAPGYFVMTTRFRKLGFSQHHVLSFSEDPIGDGFYAKFMEKPVEEVDSILWKIKKIQM